MSVGAEAVVAVSVVVSPSPRASPGSSAGSSKILTIKGYSTASSKVAKDL